MTHPPSVTGVPDELRRRLGLFDAVVIGLGSMIGAGIFAALAPAAQAAGAGLLIGLALAGVVAYCNAVSSARLAACYPSIGRHLCLRPDAAGRFLGSWRSPCRCPRWCRPASSPARCAG
jgi:basic amino acid/polyamine antiporter, APA family